MPFIKQPSTQPESSHERQQSRDCRGLEHQLDSTDAHARRWAARDLAGCVGSAAALVARLQCEDNASVREALFTSLTRLGDATAVAGLVECLRSEDTALRNDAIEALKQLPDAVAPWMQKLLYDADPDVRIFAVNVLESLRHPQVEAWLIDVIRADPHINVCATATDLLAELGSIAARPALQQLQRRFADDPYIRFATDLALKRLDEA